MMGSDVRGSACKTTMAVRADAGQEYNELWMTGPTDMDVERDPCFRVTVGQWDILTIFAPWWLPVGCGG